jgi:glycogen(starch) synthase
MNSVLMTADAVGGVWRYALDLAVGLATHGMRATLAVMGPAPQVRQLDEARRAGVDVLDRPYRLEWMEDPWADVERAGAWLLELEESLAPGIVHLNGYAHATLPWRAPTVVVAHSCVRTWWRAVRKEPPPPDTDRYAGAVAAGLDAACCVVAPTAAMQSAMRDEYRSSAPWRVIPNGTAPGPHGAPLTRKAPIVLSAGRVWDPAKNIAGLSAAAEQIEWPVYVAGSCEAPDGTVSHLTGVRTLGSLPASVMARWYDRAAIYALPARYEPFGLSVLEAAQAGCALVLGDIESLRENWDGAALFVPPDDSAALAAALQRLIRQPRERTELACRARQRASGLSLERTADAYQQLYRTLTA